MSAANEESQSSSDALPFRQGALDADAIRAKCPQFRILIIGKANAGKTTILRKVCNAKPDAKPIIYDEKGERVSQDSSKLFSLRKLFGRMEGHSTDVLNPSTKRGEHNIEYQLTYPGSNFIFHDSRGIESGSEHELEIVKKFIQTRQQHADLEKQLHVIWYCVPMDDQRPISGAEKAFFSLGTGSVPVVVIFTKFDALVDMCYTKLRNQGMEYQEAESAVPDLAEKTFQEEYLPRILNTEFPPKAHVCLAGLDKKKNQCSELSKRTMEILNNDVLVNLFVSTQKNNLDLCIKKSIEDIWNFERLGVLDIIWGVVKWFPHYWSPNRYQLAKVQSSWWWESWREEFSLSSLEEGLRWRERILKKLSQQFPYFFSQDLRKEYQELVKFQMITVIAILAEHSFWFSGGDIEEQFSHAVQSFKSHKNINTVKAEVETAFNNATDKKDSDWLIQWIIDNKLKHK